MSLAVGLLHYTSSPVVGGVETVLRWQARLMADAGCPVRMITGRGGRPDPRADLVRIALASTRHPAVRRVQAASDLGSWPAAAERLVDEIEQALVAAVSNLDVLIAHNVCSLGLNMPLTVALHRAVAAGAMPGFIAWVHDVAATSAIHQARLHAGYPWDLLRQPWPRTITVAISSARRAEHASATGLPIDEIHVVPNGIDRDRFLGLGAATVRLLDALDLRRATPVLLTPARVIPRKNLELAISVVAELRRSGEDARLLITGAPDPHDRQAACHRAALRDLARARGADDGMHLLADGPADWRSDRVIADLYRVVDVLFLPSRDEGFGLPILEAGLSRLPIVCADIPALRELAGGEATYFDPNGDPAAVAAHLRARLAEDHAHRLAGRSRAAYDWRALFTSRIAPLLAEAAGRSADDAVARPRPASSSSRDRAAVSHAS